MLFNLANGENVVFKGIENKTSKKTGQPFQLVVLADMKNVEKFEFFKRDDLEIDGVMNETKVTAIVDVTRNGYNTNVDLVSIKKSDK